MQKTKKYLTPSFLNAGELFIHKYLNSLTPIEKSESDKDIFIPSTHKYNLLIEKLEEIELCERIKDSNNYLIKVEPFKNFNIKQLITYNYIKKFMPPWFIRFRKGIDSLLELQEVDRAIFQCLKEIDIFDTPITTEAENFITEIRKLIYSRIIDERERIETGVYGEKLSMEYELDKTGNMPKRESMNNEYAGFDLISFYSNNQIKRIEVKASRFSRAFITWNEWRTALKSIKEGVEYEFHLWNINGNKKELAILNIQDLGFIPSHHKEGHHFEKYIIFFDGFRDKFKEIQFKQNELLVN